MEFELHPDRSLTPLPAPGVDTGMGLERIASVVQQVTSNYDTDLFAADPRPDARAARPRPGRVRGGALQLPGHRRPLARGHVPRRPTASLPSNEGRGYVLRRILRRAVRHGRLLGRHGAVPRRDGEGRHRHDGRRLPAPRASDGPRSWASIEREERQFTRTLEAGTDLLEEALIPLTVGGAGRRSPGGRPPAGRAGAARATSRSGSTTRTASRSTSRSSWRPSTASRVDRAGFEDALAEQRDAQPRRARRRTLARARPSWRRCTTRLLARTGDTEFLGYETTTAEGRVVAILRDGDRVRGARGDGRGRAARRRPPPRAELVLDRTPFYAEGGGQVGDTGVLRDGGRRRSLFDGRRRPARRRDADGRASPSIAACSTARSRSATTLLAEVDADRRAHTMRNHTGTHLLHRALRNVVGDQARQAGSLVHPDYLRFDFPFDRRADRRREARDRGRGAADRARGPPGEHRVDDDGRGPGRRRGRVLRREVRRQGAHDPGRGVQPRAVRRHPLPRQRPGRAAS